MRQSHLFTKTLKQSPKDEVSKNADLLIRAGYAHKEMAGVYAYLPLGIRVLEKIKQIVREEMNAIGGQELIMTAMQKKEIWEQTDRWSDEAVDVWFKSQLKNGTEVGLGWSHEEPISTMMKQYIKSYKDLPVFVYQFQTKLRNELRAKSGIMRGREFVMKDLYSYATDAEEHQKFYDSVIDAYMRVFERVGLGDDTFVTFASGGAFTKYSHEFQTICDAGEDVLFNVPGTDQYYNAEIVPALAPPIESKKEKQLDREDVHGKGIVGVEELATFLKIPIEKTTKTMLFLADKKRIIAAAVRGGYTISEVKLKDVVDCSTLELLPEDQIKKVTGAEVGYAGVIGLPDDVEVFWDDSTKDRVNFEMGANKTDYHSININFGRDVDEPSEFHDFKEAKKGDLHPETGAVYEVAKSAEVGNIFNFGTIKSEQIGLTFADAGGKNVPVHLGSYGIGITRLMGVIVEHFADDSGIVWPESVAPFHVHLVSLCREEADVAKADALYNELSTAGIEVLYDDRTSVRPGEKFADSDLIGIPHRVVISPKTLADDQVELKPRTAGEATRASLSEIAAHFARG